MSLFPLNFGCELYWDKRFVGAQHSLLPTEGNIVRNVWPLLHKNSAMRLNSFWTRWNSDVHWAVLLSTGVLWTVSTEVDTADYCCHLLAKFRSSNSRCKHLYGRCRFDLPLQRPENKWRCIWKTQSVPRSKHYISVIQTSQLMLYREIMAVCSEIHTKHINTLCGQNVELLNVKLAVYIVTTVRYI